VAFRCRFDLSNACTKRAHFIIFKFVRCHVRGSVRMMGRTIEWLPG
jgi:hypothetical protein